MTIDDVFKLAAGGCQVIGCDCKTGDIVLSPKCHPKSPVHVMVDASKGTMKINCSICDTEVLAIKHTMAN